MLCAKYSAMYLLSLKNVGGGFGMVTKNYIVGSINFHIFSPIHGRGIRLPADKSAGYGRASRRGGCVASDAHKKTPPGERRCFSRLVAFSL